MLNRKVLSIFLLFLSTFFIGPSVTPALAGGPVGDGTPVSCDDAALSAALANGGLITFNCGANPHTIIASTHVIEIDTTLDGGNLITLSGEQLRQIFNISPNAILTLNNLTVTQGGWLGNGGAISNAGNLIIDNSTIRDSYSQLGYGGGIFNTGVLTVTNSQILNNGTGPGFAGGGIDNANGTVTVLNSLISGNYSPYGGGIDSVGMLTVRGSTISNNQANVALGGGLDVGGTILIEDTTITDNYAETGGGGINATTAANLTIRHSTLVRNSLNLNTEFTTGGGILSAGLLSLQGVTLAENQAYVGGGLYVNADQATTIAATTFNNNNASQAEGGGLFLNSGPLEITNTTFSQNVAGSAGGGLYAGVGTVALTNLTFYENSASEGGGLYKTDGASLTLANTILAANSGGDCALQNPLTSNGYNLTSDATCGLTNTGDMENTDPLLAPLAYNGGPTFTHRPQTGSPVVDVIPAATCPADDQRGLLRPQGANCDVGAVELEADGIPLACGGTFVASADATIRQTDPDTGYGLDSQMQIGRDDGETDFALLNFDFATALPANATIANATLELTLRDMPNPVPYQLAVSAAATPWSEANVTWHTQPVLGTDYGSMTYQMQAGIVQIDVTALMMAWLTNPNTQHGLILRPGDETFSAISFLSHEGGDAVTAPRLIVQCGPMVAPLPGDEIAGNQAQAADLDQLEQAANLNGPIQFGNGYLRFADLRLPIPATVGNDPLAQAEWFLNEYRNLLRLDNPDSELQLVRRSENGLHLFFRQRHQGIPVFGAEIAIHLGAGELLGVSGGYAPDIMIPETPTLTAAQAEALALTGVNAEIVGDTQLRYLNLDLLGEETDGTHLTWQVNRLGGSASAAIFVDAHNGSIVFTAPNIMEDYDLDLEDGNNQLPQDLCSIWDNDNIGANDLPPDSQNAANHFRAVYDYWRNTFGRDSYDNDGEQMEVNLNVNSPNNASYGVCDLFFFGPRMVTRDIVGHEFSHAVDASEANLIYRNQSGALDESFADIFGYLIDRGNWTIGEGSAAGTLRDMSNPPALGQPDRMSNYVNTAADNGGVHTNSGINNKAAYLIMQGGTFNGFTVRGLGSGVGQRLYHNLLTNRVSPNTDLWQMANLAISEASNMGLNQSDVCQVRNAYAAVQLTNGDRDCDGLIDNIDPDDDGDYIPDTRDNCVTVFNPFQTDIDGDGIGDACDPDIDNDGRLNAQDNCANTYNPSQADWNSDGEGDVCDDSDGDSIRDDRDNCRTIWNFDQRDQDHDGIGDKCDIDIDGDGRLNVWDNCPVHRNPGQEDTTEMALGLAQDGVGDVCDLCPAVSSSNNTDLDNDGLANPCDDDDDGDGVIDVIDNCPLEANASQLDTDNNGIGFACDLDERANFGQILADFNRRYSLKDLLFPIPVPICPECGANYLPNRFESVINLELPVPFQARVVDSNGTVVAKSVSTSLNQSLNFSPAPFAITRQFGPLAAQRSSSAALGEPAPDETMYYLEIVPEPGTDLTQPYEMALSVSEGVEAVDLPQKVYLPILMR